MTQRLPDMPVRDPFIVPDAATGTYHLYTTNVPSASAVPGTGVMVYRSRDLRGWDGPEVVFRPADQDGIWAVDGCWAPEVHAFGGRHYLFTTLHDEARWLPVPPADPHGVPLPIANFRRGTVIAASDSLLGPFTVLDPTGPTPPAELMTLDGTLYVDPDDQPWMVYAGEWVQRIDGTVEAIRLTDDFSGTVGDPIHVFKGSDANWIGERLPAGVPHQIAPYVTDGPQLYRLPSGALLMLWSTYEKTTAGERGIIDGDYVQTAAVADSGRLAGPWRQHRPVVRGDSGHGMLFRTFDERWMLVLHRPFKNARAKLYDVELTDDGIEVLRQRTDLDGGG